MTTQQLGAAGEDHAADYLQQQSWEVLDRNWRCRLGEIDIIARHDDAIVAVEVKTRRGGSCGHPAEAVTPRKLARVRRLLATWLDTHGEHADELRVDVIAITRHQDGSMDLDHLMGVW